jgi:hypothetical protein
MQSIANVLSGRHGFNHCSDNSIKMKHLCNIKEAANLLAVSGKSPIAKALEERDLKADKVSPISEAV